MKKNYPYDYNGGCYRKPLKWTPITPEQHEEIKRTYQNKKYKDGSVARLAEKLGIPKWKVSKYAASHGFLKTMRKKDPNWTKEEVRILQKNAHNSPEVIQKKLKKHGFSRTVCGIFQKRKAMRMLRNLEGQCARSLAECLGVEEHFVTRMIKCGNLKAIRRKMNRKESQGGNPYLIIDKDVKEFIINNLDQIDLRKVDKYWFVDLLVNG